MTSRARNAAAWDARFEKQASAEVGEHILATDEWAQALSEHPFESSKYIFAQKITKL